MSMMIRTNKFHPLKTDLIILDKNLWLLDIVLVLSLTSHIAQSILWLLDIVLVLSLTSLIALSILWLLDIVLVLSLTSLIAQSILWLLDIVLVLSLTSLKRSVTSRHSASTKSNKSHCSKRSVASRHSAGTKSKKSHCSKHSRSCSLSHSRRSRSHSRKRYRASSSRSHSYTCPGAGVTQDIDAVYILYLIIDQDALVPIIDWDVLIHGGLVNWDVILDLALWCRQHRSRFTNLDVPLHLLTLCQIIRRSLTRTRRGELLHLLLFSLYSQTVTRIWGMNHLTAVGSSQVLLVGGQVFFLGISHFCPTKWVK